MTSYPGLSRELLLEILSAVPETIVMIDEDLTVQYVSAPEKEGYTEADVTGARAVDFVPSEHRDAHRERLLRVLESGEEATFELPIIDAKDDIVWVEGTLTPIEREGRVVGIVSASRDATARRVAEEEAEKLRSLIPVCSWCGKIRSDEGYWEEVESYIEEHSGVRVTHGICPDCEGTLRGDGTDGPA